MEDILRLTLLFDFYGGLLSEKQKEIFDMYYLEDYSLQEIGEQMGLTRQGVRDHIVRCEKLLTKYESKLKLVEDYNLKKHKIDKINTDIDNLFEDELLTEPVKTVLLDIKEYFKNYES